MIDSIRRPKGSWNCGNSACNICFETVNGKRAETGRFCPNGITQDEFDEMQADDFEIDESLLVHDDDEAAPVPEGIEVDWSSIFDDAQTATPPDAEIVYLPANRTDKTAT